MRTHAQIVHDATVPALRRALADRGLAVPDPTVRSWTRRPDEHGSIPATYWAALAEAKITTLEELAAHAQTTGARGEAA